MFLSEIGMKPLSRPRDTRLEDVVLISWLEIDAAYGFGMPEALEAHLSPENGTLFGVHRIVDT